MEAFSRSILSVDPSQYSQELVERLDILRRNEMFCDVKVVVKDKEFKAHKAVLAAASPFFLKLQASDMRESKEQLIKLELEEVTASVMEDVLQYIYTGNVSVIEESAHNLIAIADNLLLPGLRTMACNFLEDNVTIENCVFNYYFADKCQCVKLREGARDVIQSNFTAVIETEDFLNLNTKQVMEWVSSDDITVNAEQEIFKGIVKWVSHNRSEREVDFPILLQQVRLVSISHDFLLEQLVKEELVVKNAGLFFNFVLDAMRLMVSANDGDQAFQQPRKCLETHADAIFVCGGRRSLCYFPKQNVWYKLSNMLRDYNCEYDSPTQWTGKIYIPCWMSDDELDNSDLMQCYTPATNSWGVFQVATTFSRSFFAVCKGDLYAIHDDWGERTYICKCDPEKNCSNELQKPSTACYKSCVVVDEQYIYIIGGSSNFFGDESFSTTLRFDPCANEWEEVASINEARYAAFGAAMNGKLYIAGGCQNEKVLSTCEVYNPLTNEWQLMPSLKIPRMSASMVCYEKELHVLGGYNFGTGGCKWSQIRVLSVEIFDCERNEWKEKSLIPVKCFETYEEEEKNKFKACFARLNKKVINKLKPLE